MNKIITMLASASAGANTSKITVNTSVDAFGVLGDVLNLVLKLLSYVGVGAIAFGIYELAMGLTQEGQAQKKVTGLIFIFAGALLIGVRVLLTTLGVIS